MKLKLTIDEKWKEKYQKQSNLIKDWIGKNASLEEKFKLEENGPELNLFDEYLRGTDIAGIGQGRFSNNAKSKVKEAWAGQVHNLLKAVKDASDNNLFNACENLQKKLIEFCKKTKKKGEEDVEIDEHKPWAAIHAMIVAIQPKVFCTIVSEGNLDELFNKMSDVAKNNDSEEGATEGNTINLKFSNEWNILKEEWKEAKNHDNDNMSWYYKSAAIQKYFKTLFVQDDSWIYSNYPWATLEALRGEENEKVMSNKLEKQKNLILTGAPGTGKTYLAKRIASRLIFGKTYIPNTIKENNLKNSDQYEFVQFHPSYDYTDFVEGLRPNETGTSFTRMDGIFKAFCAKAAIAEKEDNKLIREGIKKEDKKRMFVFVIDEINRGEISKIFGELFFSIDPGYRGEFDKDGNDNKVKTQYQNLIGESEIVRIKNDKDFKDEKYPFIDGFYVPSNVYIIGTMNDIDRSVESMDFAFRRRFAFVEISAEDSSAIIYSAKEEEGWNADLKQTTVDRMNCLNKAIIKKCGLTAQYQIGGAYFLKLEDVNFRFDKLWSDYLQGTLYEYFRGLPTNEIDEKMKVLKEAYDNGVDDE